MSNHLYRFYIYIAITIVAVYLLCEWSNYYSRRYPSHVKQGMNDCIVEAARLSTRGKSTENDLLAAMQQVEAAAIMRTLKMLAPEDDINALTLIRYAEVNKEIKDQEAIAMRKLVRKCTQVIPTNSRLAHLAGVFPNQSDESSFLDN